MPEIKHTFQGGKMNKDLDERLVPNGEYRDAMNIQVRTTPSDGEGDSGTVQNIAGNELINNIHAHYETSYVSTVSDSKNETRVISSVADEKNNKAYFFVAAPEIRPMLGPSTQYVTGQKLFIDTIVEVETNPGSQATVNDPTTNPIVIDKWAIIDRWKNMGPAAEVTTATFNNLTVDSSIFDQLRVGMVMDILKQDGTSLIKGRMEIRELTSGEIPNVHFYNTKATPDWQEAFVVVFVAPRTLNFQNPIGPNKRSKASNIHGVNIIDEMLFWTDNKTEPKKINIRRCKAGTAPYNSDGPWTTHTKLMLSNPIDDEELDLYTDIEDSLTAPVNDDLREEHITVIRKAPRYAPTLTMRDSDREGEVNVVGLQYDFYGIADAAGDEFEQGYQVTITDALLQGNTGPNWLVNDVLIFTEEVGALEGMGVIKATLDSFDKSTGTIQLTILSISSTYKAM